MSTFDPTSLVKDTTPKPSATPSPAATALAKYIDDAHANGYGGFDPNTLVATSSGATGSAGHNSVLDSVKHGMASAWSSIGHFFSDPSSNTPKTTSQNVQDHFNNTGIKPFTPVDLQTIQANLQGNGYGKDLKPNGTWDADWSNAAYQYGTDKQHKLGAGTFGAREVFDTVFGPSFLSHAIPLIATVGKNLASEALQLPRILDKASQAALSVGPLGVKPTQPTIADQFGHAADSAARMLDHKEKQTLDQYMQTPLGWKDAFIVADAAATASILAKGMKVGFEATRGAVAAGKEAGATSTAKALVTDLGKQERPNKWIMNSLFPETASGARRFAFTKSMQNMPILNSMYDVSQKVANGIYEGWQTFRGAAATPYRLPIVGAVGKAGAEVGMTGLKLGLVGNTEKFLGQEDAPTAQTLDHLKPIAGLVGNTLNLLQIGLHGPTYDVNGNPSHVIGTKVEDLRQKVLDALDQNSIRADWERGTGSNYTQIAADLAKQGISSDILDYSILNNYHDKVAQYAAKVMYEDKVAKGKLDPTKSDVKQNFLQETSHLIRNNPDLLTKAVETYKLNEGQFAADLLVSTKNMLSDKTYNYSNDFTTKLIADNILRPVARDGNEWLTTPQTISRAVEQNKRAIREATSPANYEQGLKELEQEMVRTGKVEQRVMERAKENGLFKKGVQVRITQKQIDATSNANAKAKLQEQFAIQQELGNAAKASAKAKRDYNGALNKNIKLGAKSYRQPGLSQYNPWDEGFAYGYTPVTQKFPLSAAENAALADENLTPSFGLMKKERQTAGDAQAQARVFYKELQKAKPGFQAPRALDIKSDVQDYRLADEPVKLPKTFDPSKALVPEQELRSNVMKYLGEELNVNIKDLTYVPTENLIDLIVKKSSKLAGDVAVPPDAPEWVINAMKRIDDLGYKPVFGTDIGHAYNYTPDQIANLGSAQSWYSKLADKIGLNVQKVDPSVAGKVAHATMLKNIAEHLNRANPTDYPVWATADRMMNFLTGVIKPTMSPLMSGLHQASSVKGTRQLLLSRGWAKEIKALMESDPALTEASAKAIIQDSINTQTSPIFWTRKQVVDALTKKGDANGNIDLYINGKNVTVQAVGLSEKQAGIFYNVMRKGMGSTPTFVSGLNPILKVLDSSFYIGDKAIPMPINKLIDSTTGLKTTLLNWKYQASPRFAWLRVLKSAIKGTTENVPFSLNAAESLREAGIYDKAMALRDMYLGKDQKFNDLMDIATKEYNQADIFNIYNPKAIEARILWYLHHDALAKGPVDRAEVLKKFEDVYSYGKRTALEKSINAFFFPFSFEKTVVRQLGGMMLDEPVMRLAAAQAIALYDAHEQDIKDWSKKHAPIIQELEKFNPFYHGVGIGVAGGIFRPSWDVATGITKAAFVQLTQPQAITDANSLRSTLNMIPVLKDLNNIVFNFAPPKTHPSGMRYSELVQTILGAKQAVENWTGKPKSAWTPQAGLTYEAQQNEAWNLRSKLMTQGAQILLANRNGSNYQFPANVPVVGGLKVSSQSINDLVHHVYPQWHSSQIMAGVGMQQEAIGIQREVMQNKAPSTLPMYDQFIKYADKIRTVVSKQDVKPEALAQWTMAMRQAASQLSSADPSFGAFYKKYFESKFGPLGEL